MPHLLLFRHAKSCWEGSQLSDFERPLAQRGVKAAPLMGAEIAARGWQPDLALLSPALRAWQTWDLASAQWEKLPETRFEERLYMAMPAAIRDLLHAVPRSFRCIIIVGHNPGLQDLALSLAGPDSDPEAAKRITRKFPTAAVARFSIDNDWPEMDTGASRLTHFVRPKDVKRRERIA